MCTDITFEVLDELFTYNPLTGQIHAKVRQGRFSAGDLIDTKTWSGHVQIIIGKKVTSGHKVALVLSGIDVPVGMVIDHIDGDPQNNKLCNLRVVTQSQNNFNRQRVRTDASGNTVYPGVSYDETAGKWVVKHGRAINGACPERRMPSLFEAMCLKKRLQNGAELPPRMRKNSIKLKHVSERNV